MVPLCVGQNLAKQRSVKASVNLALAHNNHPHKQAFVTGSIMDPVIDGWGLFRLVQLFPAAFGADEKPSSGLFAIGYYETTSLFKLLAKEPIEGIKYIGRQYGFVLLGYRH